MRQHVREVVNRKIAAGDRFLTLVEGPSLLGSNRLDGLVDGVHPNDLGFQWMADGLAPILAKAMALPPVLVDDHRLTTSIDTAEQKREAIIRYIWGDAGFPRTMPAAMKERRQSGQGSEERRSGGNVNHPNGSRRRKHNASLSAKTKERKTGGPATRPWLYLRRWEQSHQLRTGTCDRYLAWGRLWSSCSLHAPYASE